MARPEPVRSACSTRSRCTLAARPPSSSPATSAASSAALAAPSPARSSANARRYRSTAARPGPLVVALAPEAARARPAAMTSGHDRARQAGFADQGPDRRGLGRVDRASSGRLEPGGRRARHLERRPGRVGVEPGLRRRQLDRAPGRARRGPARPLGHGLRAHPQVAGALAQLGVEGVPGGDLGRVGQLRDGRGQVAQGRGRITAGGRQQAGPAQQQRALAGGVGADVDADRAGRAGRHRVGRQRGVEPAPLVVAARAGGGEPGQRGSARGAVVAAVAVPVGPLPVERGAAAITTPIAQARPRRRQLARAAVGARRARPRAHRRPARPAPRGRGRRRPRCWRWRRRAGPPP